jgi:hypothetical protein
MEAGAVERAGCLPIEPSTVTDRTSSTVWDRGLPVKAPANMPPKNGARIPNRIAEEMKMSRGHNFGDSRLI